MDQEMELLRMQDDGCPHNEGEIMESQERTTGLCLSRRVNELVRIKTESGEIVWVQILGFVRGGSGKVKMRIIADRTTNIMRDEILPVDEQFRG